MTIDEQRKLEQVVGEGAKMLDRNWGNGNGPQEKDWFEIIDLATLDLSDGEYCILGQLGDGCYLTGLIELGLASADVVAYGLELRQSELRVLADWDIITTYWLNEIADRIRSRLRKTLTS